MDKGRVWDAARRKLRARMGYNLFETMVTLLILSLMSGGMAAGVRFASEQYRVSMTKSESMVLCSTLCDKIKDTLRNAEMKPKPSEAEFDSENPKFWSRVAGDGSFIYDWDGEIWIGDKAMDDGTNSPSLASNERLIPKAAYSSFKLESELKDHKPIPYDMDLKCFRVELIIRDAKGKTVAESQFDVFPLN